MRILAIETSCDETAIALCECDNLEFRNLKFEIICEAVASQIKVHRPFGGVVPTLAKREHIKNLLILLKKIFKSYKPAIAGLYDFDSIAVTVGPGLEPALWTGINFANELGKKMNVPVIGINHLEGHIYSNWLPPSPVILSPGHNRDEGSHRYADKILSSPASGRAPHNDARVNIAFPAICLIVSGGHTILLKMDSIKKWKKLGETRDDAVGEAFDKVAKMLKLPYPGGPEVEKLAKKGNSSLINFPRPMINNKNYDFSFSGLKTAVLYHLRDFKKIKKEDVCASFQQAAVDVLAVKTIRAAKEFEAKSILLCGGVAANKVLQNRLKEEGKKLKADFYVPELKYNTDNAVMIAAAAYLGNHYPTDKALPNLNL